MPAKTLMVQGTASSVGKSLLVTALCRIFRQDGFRVAPFKAQNMALNSFVTRDGGEIGRAQAVQAEAAGIAPTVDMNPVLLKPEADARCQVIVRGRVAENLSAGGYYQYAPKLRGIIAESLDGLRAKYDLVVIEGAGSPAEINLKEKDIVNMAVARMAQAPVLLVGDIDRGGVFAAMVGTLALLSAEERRRIKGLVINKFRGEQALLQPGLDLLEAKTGKPVLGVIPFIRDIRVAQEDSVFLDERPNGRHGGLDIAVIRLPHIANYDDFDPLEEKGCSIRYISGASELGRPDLIILPGTKSTAADLDHLKQTGLADEIVRQAESGVPVIGICGGFQMLGRKITDPDHVESGQSVVSGLGLLDIETTFQRDKTTRQVRARVNMDRGLFAGSAGIEVTGYEIHMGQTQNSPRPAFRVFSTPQGEADYPDGSASDNGLIFGSYIHGLFHNDRLTGALLNNLRRVRGLPDAATSAVNNGDRYDRWAAIVRQSLDMPRINNITLGKRYGDRQ